MSSKANTLVGGEYARSVCSSDVEATTVQGSSCDVGSTAAKLPTGLDWNGPEDPDNPWNWPMRKRWFGTIVPGALCLLVLVPLPLPVLRVAANAWF